MKDARPHARFLRAIERHQLAQAEDAAREIPRLSLPDALALTLLLSENRDPRFYRAATRWAGRVLTEHPELGLDRAAELVKALRDVDGASPPVLALSSGSFCAQLDATMPRTWLASGGGGCAFRPKCNIGHGRRRPQPRVAALDAADGQQAASAANRDHSLAPRGAVPGLAWQSERSTRRRLHVASHLIER
jgi:hypothetical protein